MGDRNDLAKVLEPLYASVLEPARMQDFCDRLTALTGSSLGALVVEDLSHREGSLGVTSGASSEELQLYSQEYAADNVWVNASVHVLATGKLFDSDDCVPRETYLRSRYYNEFLSRFDDIRQSLALCALRENDSVVMMTISRAGRMESFTAPQRLLAQQVLPHWVNAYAVQRRLSWLERQTRTLEQTLHGVSGALFMLGADGSVQGMNAAAERCLQPFGPLRIEQGRLCCDHDRGHRLGHALHDATIGRPFDGGLQRHQGSAPLRSAGGRVVAIATAHPLPRTLDLPVNDGRAVALLFVQGLWGARKDGLAALLRQLFDLTPAEAALAAALHDEGDLGLAANTCGIASSTAHSRIKLVYDKTGERGQAALMRLLSAVARTLPE